MADFEGEFLGEGAQKGSWKEERNDIFQTRGGQFDELVVSLWKGDD